MKQPRKLQVVSIIDVINDVVSSTIKADFVDDSLVGVLRNLGSEVIEKYNEVFVLLVGYGSYTKNPCKSNLDLNNCESLPAKPSISYIPHLEFKLSPLHFSHVFLG